MGMYVCMYITALADSPRIRNGGLQRLSLRGHGFHSSCREGAHRENCLWFCLSFSFWRPRQACFNYLSRFSFKPFGRVVLTSKSSFVYMCRQPDMSCFQGLLFCPEAFSLLLHNFCIYHINPPGHELGAAVACPEEPLLSVDDLAEQIAEILNYFGLGAVMCLGVTAGAYILTLFALKYSKRVMGLILVSPLCKAPCWTEWFWNKVMSNLLYICGMCGLAKDLLLMRYFSKVVRGSVDVPESDVVQSCRRLLGERQSPNVLRFLEALNGRPDITDGLRKLQCRSLIFVGENSPFHYEALHMTSKLDRRFSALVEVCYSSLFPSVSYVTPWDNKIREQLFHIYHANCLTDTWCSLVRRPLKVSQSSVGQRHHNLEKYTQEAFLSSPFLHLFVHILAGSSLRLNGYRRTTGCNVDTIGIFPHGVWLLQTISIQWEPTKPLESNVHCP